MQLGAASLVGCSKSQPKSEASTKAGPFSLTIPAGWNKTIIVEKVPIQPLYSREDWKAYQADKQNMLKPAYVCRPQHWAIRVPDALPEGVAFDRKNAGDDPTAPQILIHKADEWNVAFTDGEHEEIKAADLPRSLRESMDAALTQDNPHLSPGFTDASLAFICLKRRIDFSGGHGVRLVTQWTIEPELMRLGSLHYLFLGMSDDNSCQIIGTFPLSLPGLPKAEERNHLGRGTENFEGFSKEFEAYVDDGKRWLTQHEDEITPSIRTLDEMMQSLVVRRWE